MFILMLTFDVYQCYVMYLCILTKLVLMLKIFIPKSQFSKIKVLYEILIFYHKIWSPTVIVDPQMARNISHKA